MLFRIEHLQVWEVEEEGPLEEARERAKETVAEGKGGVLVAEHYAIDLMEGGKAIPEAAASYGVGLSDA